MAIDDKSIEQLKQELEALKNKKEGNIATAEELELLKQINKEIKKRSETQKESIDLIQQSVRFARDEFDIAQQQMKGATSLFDTEQKRLNLEKSRLKLLEAEFLESKKSGKLSEDELKNLKENIDKQKLLTRELQQQETVLEQQKKKYEQIKNQVVDIASRARNFASTINVAVGGMFPIANLLSFQSVLEVLGRQRREAMEANANFVRVTGQSTEMLKNLQGSLGAFGILPKDQAAAYGELFVTMSGFSRLNGEMQGQMVNAAARMKNLGVDVATTGKNYDELTLSLRMNASVAMDTQDKLAKVAIGAGIAPSKMLKDFASAMPQLAGYGKKAVEVFVDLQKQSKSLGIELQTLTGIVGDQFDTFEGAANAAGKLNAILGGNYINSVELLNASEEERVEILKRGMEMSGKSMDSLGKFGQKAVGSALQIKDLSTVNKLFGKSTSEMKDDMNSQAASQERLIKAQKDAGDVANKLEAATRQLAKALEPVQKVLTFLMEAFSKLSKETKEYIVWAFALGTPLMAIFTTGALVIKTLASIGTAISISGAAGAAAAPGMAAAGAAGAAAAPGVAAVGGAGAAAAPGIAAVGASGAAAAPGITAVGTSAALSASSIIAFGVAVMFVGAGIGLAAYGLSYLIAAFKDLSGEQILAGLAALIIVLVGFVKMIAVMIPIISALGAVSAAVGGPLVALGFAFLLIGGGIAIASFGMSKLVESFATLSEKGGSTSSAIWAIVAAMTGFAVIMGIMIPIISALGAVSAAVGGPLIALGAAMLLIGVGFSAAMLGISSLTEMANNPDAGTNLGNIAAGMLALSGAMTAIAAIGTGGGILSLFGGGSSGFASQILEIVNAIKQMPDNIDVKINAFKDIKETLMVATKVKTEDIKPSVDFIKEAKTFYQAQVQAKQGEQDALMSVLKALAGSKEGADKTNKSGELPIILRIENSSDIRAALSIGGAAALGQGK